MRRRLSRRAPEALAIAMLLEVRDADGGVLSLSLVGRLDTPGVDSIETPLTAHLVPRAARAMIDLSQIAFIGSAGIRMFITIARALGRRGGKLVLYGAQPLVAQVLETASLDAIVPVRPDAAAAAAVVRD
ncbi:MAG: STAS domain-containing protein [Gammaproteobacteria bacterium]|nr:STAS domain-containing protein [Gammaproteobacteria bacterium]